MASATATRTVRFVERLTVPLEPGARPRARLFEKNRRLLLAEEKTCWACGRADEIEAHHIVPWSMRALMQPERLGWLLDAFDPYEQRPPEGGGKPIHDINDIRNLILLCHDCHQGPGLGAHALSMPTWLASVACRPDAAITVEQAVKRGVA